MMRSLPFCSVTRIVFASANAMPQGWERPVATAVTRILPPCTSITCGADATGDGGGGGACPRCAKQMLAVEKTDTVMIDAMTWDLSVMVGESYHSTNHPANLGKRRDAIERAFARARDRRSGVGKSKD